MHHRHLLSTGTWELPKGKVGHLAQLVEQRTFDTWFDGSSPLGPNRDNIFKRGAGALLPFLTFKFDGS